MFQKTIFNFFTLSGRFDGLRVRNKNRLGVRGPLEKICNRLRFLTVNIDTCAH